MKLDEGDDAPSTTTKKVNIKTVCNLLNICAGTVGIDKNKKIILSIGTRDMDVMDIKPDDYAYIDKTLELAYFGSKNEKVTDPTVRKSKHTKTFNINLDIQSILNSINVKGFIQQYKLNFYQQGDFFLQHRDTNHPGLVGTLIIILPTDCVGGDLCFGDYNIEDVMDKSKLRFIYFNGELEHSVSKVQSGKRISLVWNVFDPSYRSSNVVKPKSIDVYFPKEHYPKLLDYTMNYCEGKTNILLGYYKHRNDVFKKLLNDIVKIYQVIKVSVGRDGPISKILEVHTLKDQEAWDDVRDYEQDFDALIDETYEIRHTLFADHCKLTQEEMTCYKEEGWTGNSPDTQEYEVEHYTAYLINPSDESLSGDEESSNDDESPESPSGSSAEELSIATVIVEGVF